MKQKTRREFNSKERQKIYDRDDHTCIFCKMGYHMEDVMRKGQGGFSVMHYIPRSKNGMGIEENAALGCQTHHDMLDNGYQGRRSEMLELFAGYLSDMYPDWNEDDLVYSKWG